MSLNPHNWLIRLGTPPLDRWRCEWCGDEGSYDELEQRVCSYVYPACEFCGQTPTCAADCIGIAKLLRARNGVVKVEYQKLRKFEQSIDCSRCDAQVELWAETEEWEQADDDDRLFSWRHSEYGPSHGQCDACGAAYFNTHEGLHVLAPPEDEDGKQQARPHQR